jgi:hypothetical protein
LVGALEPVDRLVVAPGLQMAVRGDTAVQMDIGIADIDVHGTNRTCRASVRFTGEYLCGTERPQGHVVFGIQFERSA